MGVEPVAAHRRCADHADRFIILPSDFFCGAFFPWMCAQFCRPGISVAFSAEADQHRGGAVSMGLRIASGFMLADPEIEMLSRHMRFYTPITRRPAVIHGQFATHDVWNNIGLTHRQTAHRVWSDLFFVLVIVVRWI